MDKKFIFFLLLVIVILIVAGIFKYGQETPTTRSTSQQPSSGSSQQPSGSTGDLHPYSADGSSITIHQTPDGYQIHGRVVYSGNGPPDDTFKELLHNYLISRGISQININNIDVSSREIVDGDENINFQIHCDDCEIIEGYQIDMNIFEGQPCRTALTTDDYTANLCAYRVAGVLGGSWLSPPDTELAGYDINEGTKSLKAEHFRVDVRGCSQGWSPVNLCIDPVSASRKDLTIDGQSKTYFNNDEGLSNCEGQEGRWISTPTAVAPASPADGLTSYKLHGCLQDCQTPTSLETGASLGFITGETTSTNLSVFGFNTQYTCGTGYGPDSPQRAVPCRTDLRGEGDTNDGVTYTALLCTEDCMPPNSPPPGYTCDGTVSDAVFPNCGGNIHRSSNPFNPNMVCGDGYSGSVSADKCEVAGEMYTLSGCSLDCVRDPDEEVKGIGGMTIEKNEVYNIHNIDETFNGFSLDVSCGDNYSGQIGYNKCPGLTDGPDNNYKLYGCYPDCDSGTDECLNLRVEYDDQGPSYRDFKTDLNRRFTQELPESNLNSETDMTFFRKYISNGKAIIEYQIKCPANECDIIGALPGGQEVIDAGDVLGGAEFGTADWRTEQELPPCAAPPNICGLRKLATEQVAEAETAEGEPAWITKAKEDRDSGTFGDSWSVLYNTCNKGLAGSDVPNGTSGDTPQLCEERYGKTGPEGTPIKCEWKLDGENGICIDSAEECLLGEGEPQGLPGGGRGYQWICENDECNTVCDADCQERGGGQRALPEDVRWNEKISTPCQIHHDDETFWYGKKGEDGAECPSSCYCPEGTVRIDQNVDISFADMVTTAASWGVVDGQDYPDAADKQRIMDSWKFQCVPA